MSVPTAGSSRGRAQFVVVAALLVTVIAVALAVVNAIKLSDDSNSANRSGSTSALAAGATTAVAEAGQIAVDFTSFNYQHLSQDLAATARHATPTFAKTYLAQSRLVAPVIQKAKAVSTSQVVASGLASYSPTAHTATVIVALNDTTKNTKAPAGTVQYFRMQVQMVNQNGQWLANQVTPE